MTRLRPTDQPRIPPLALQTRIVLEGKNWTVEELASRYKPIIRQRSTSRDKPVRMTYEFLDETLQFVVKYYVIWSDEVHPVPIVDVIYRLFRNFYYGSSSDIERIEIVVDKTSGKVSKVLFETEPPKASSVFPSHARATLSRTNQKYTLSIDDTAAMEVNPWFRDRRIELLVASWNHEFAVSFSPSGTAAYDPPMKLLGDHEYATFRYATRTTGNLGTTCQKARTMILLVCWFALSPLIILMARLKVLVEGRDKRLMRA